MQLASRPVLVRRQPGPARFAVAALALLTLAAAVLALIAGRPATAQAAPVAITEGSVDWGFKASWRAYIGEAGIMPGGGVTRTLDGGFRWPVASGSYDPDTRALELELGGSVHFTAHAGLLDSTLSNGHLLIGSEATELRFDIRSKNMAGEWVEFTDAPLAVLDVEAVDPAVAGGQTSWTGIPSAITQQGADAFTYGAGTPLDPLSIAYTGPGGKPDLAEQWTPPGTRGYAKTHVRDLLPGADWAAGLRTGAFDEANGILHVIGFARGASAPTLLAIDLTSGQIVAEAGPISWPTAGDTGKGPFAFDAAHATAFVRTPDNKLVAHAWNPTSREYESEVLAEAVPAGNILIYDPVGETVALMNTSSNASLLLVQREEDGSFGEPVARTVTGGGFGNNLVIDAQGQALLTRASSTDRLLQFDPGLAAPVAAVIPGVAPNTGIVALGRDGEAWVAGTVTSFQRLQRVVRTPEGYVKSGDPTPLPTVVTGLLSGPGGELIYGPTTLSNQIHVFADGQVKATIDVAGPADFANKRLIVKPRADGSLLVVHPDPAFTGGSIGLSWPLDRYDFTGLSPSVTEQPASPTVTLQAGEQSAPAELSVLASGTPAPQVRWQSRAGGIGRFTDLPGATAATLALDAKRADNGTEYRAVLTNVNGSLATAPATLTVRYAPEISQQPVSVAVTEGEDATLKVMPLGNPHPTVTWQRRVGGFWTAVDAGDGDVEVSGEGGGFLTIKGTSLAQSGAVFRAKVANAVGTVFSGTATLTVNSAAAEPVSFGSGSLQWGFANRWRCYVTGTIAQGGIEVSGGITRVPGTEASGGLCPGAGEGSQAFSFPVRGGSYDPATGDLEVKLNGSVRFWGHAYHVPGNTTPQLDTTFSDLKLIASGGEGTIYADATGATMENPTPVTRDDVPLVTVDLTGSGPVPNGELGLDWSGAETTLSAAGAEVFGSYPAGEPFDPLAMSLVFGTPQPDPEPEAKPTPQLPSPLPVPGPTGPAARVKAGKASQSLGSNRVARLGTLACPAQAPCQVLAPKRVRTKVAGKSYGARVLVPKWIGAGKSVPMRVRLPKAAAARLKAKPQRKAIVAVEVSVLANGNTTTQRLRVVVRG